MATSAIVMQKSHGSSLLAIVARALAAPVVALDALWTRYRAREELERLDDRLLADIGLTRADLYGETPDVMGETANQNWSRPAA